MSAPSWTEVRVLVPAGWHELVAEAIRPDEQSGVALGAPSLGTEQAPEGWSHVRAFVERGTDDEDWRASVRRRLDGLADRSGAMELRDLPLSFHELPAEDYARSWKKSWKPFRLGRLCILPPWYEYELATDELRLVLEPGGAFGSGRHATTRACLRAIQRRVRPGQSVLDAGTGNGVLSVAALLFGAGRAVAFDNDPHAIPYARVLAASNRVADACEFRVGGFEALDEKHAGFDAVLANIYADVIQEHAVELARRLRPGGWFAFSGCPAAKRDATAEAIRNAGLTIEEEPVRGRWHTFVGTRSRG